MLFEFLPFVGLRILDKLSDKLPVHRSCAVVVVRGSLDISMTGDKPVNKVLLQKLDGSQVWLSLSKLSGEDQSWVQMRVQEIQALPVYACW